MATQSSSTRQQVRSPVFLRRTAFTAVFSALLMPLGMTTASGQHFLEIQEDWELVIAQPNAISSAPQVTCVISPYSHVDRLHVALELNQQTYPHYTPGGVQLHLWNGEDLLQSKQFPSDAIIETPGETITWTQKMAIAGSKITFEVNDAASTTWGDFGSGDHLYINVPGPVTDLDSYSPEVSVQHSGVGYAANRVQRLVLKEVRYYTVHGLFVTDTTERVVYELEE